MSPCNVFWFSNFCLKISFFWCFCSCYFLLRSKQLMNVKRQLDIIFWPKKWIYYFINKMSPCNNFDFFMINILFSIRKRKEKVYTVQSEIYRYWEVIVAQLSGQLSLGCENVTKKLYEAIMYLFVRYEPFKSIISHFTFCYQLWICLSVLLILSVLKTPEGEAAVYCWRKYKLQMFLILLVFSSAPRQSSQSLSMLF